MRRFFVDSDFSPGQVLLLSGDDFRDEIKHMTKTLRLQPGAEIGLLNGRGGFALAKIQKISRDAVELLVASASERLPRWRIHLVQAALKGPRMDWLVEKITEWNAVALYPVWTEFSVAAEEGGRIDRWQRIAQAAIKQSGAGLLPEIHAVQDLAAVDAALPKGCARVVLHPEAGAQPLAALARQIVADAALSQNRDIALLIGPEGGFSDSEIEKLRARGWRMAALGETILRGETAGIAGTAILSHCVDFWTECAITKS